MIAPQLTRRAALGSGLAFASVAGTISGSAYGQTAGRALPPQMIDAMLIDTSIAMPSRIATFIEARRRTIPIVDMGLDAAAHARLKRVFGNSRAMIGISSGATLFCLERIAWDHGFRLTARNQRSVCDLDNRACTQDVVDFLNGAHPAAISPTARAYRPSRADGMLHAWTMQKSARSHFSQDQQEA